jgi:hypothetical protein
MSRGLTADVDLAQKSHKWLLLSINVLKMMFFTGQNHTLL